MKRKGKTEVGFYNILVTKAMDDKDPFMFRELLLRLSPIPKSVNELVEFTFPKKAKPHEQAAAVLEAIAKGVIPNDVGNTFIQSIKAAIDIEEYTDLKTRIEEIEKSLGITNG